MRAIISAAAMWIAAAGAAAGDGSDAPSAAGATPVAARDIADPRITNLERFIDGFVAAVQADHYPPGLTIAIATPEGYWTKAYGVADMESGAPATADTLFRIGSVSKTFVWVAVMMLVEEGRIDLSADVNGYLKKARVPEAFGAPVTMNDLMAHRAGFEDTLGDFFEGRSGRSYEEALIRQAPKRVAPPGARTAYSNWGTDLAAQVVADVSGVAFDEFVRRRILSPLGMSETLIRDPGVEDAALALRVARPHKLTAGAPEAMAHDVLEPLHAAGAVSMSGHDAARWLGFLLSEGQAGGARLLSPETFSLMRRRNYADRSGAPDFAHGFMENEVAGHLVYGHGGTLSGFITSMQIAPDLGIGVLVAVNAAEGPVRTPDLLTRAVIEQWAGASSYAAKWTGEGRPEAAARIAGSYLGARRVHSKFEKALALGSDIAARAEPDGTLAVTAAGATRRYYPLSDDLWTDRISDSIYVYRDGSGEPAGIAYRLGTDTAAPLAFRKSSAAFGAGLGAALLLSVTAFLGLWRRFGRKDVTRPLGRAIAVCHVGAAALWIGFATVFGASIGALSGVNLAELQAQGWPPAGLELARLVGHAAALGAFVSALLLPSAILASGWSIWRKAHFALFALAGLAAVVALFEWRLILAPMTRV